MIIYNTKDIIKKAKQLADLVNSDFISYDENFSLLNDAYMELYQKAINSGDNTYVKTIELKAEYQSSSNNVQEFCLPCDFYQLRSIYSSDGIAGTPIPRKSKNEMTFTRCYEIKNNVLYVYGISTMSVTMEYYPIPETLTVASSNIYLNNIEYEGEFFNDLYKNHIVSYIKEDTSNISIVVRDLRTGDKKVTKLSGSNIKFIKAIAGDNEVIVEYQISDTKYIKEFYYNSNKAASSYQYDTKDYIAYRQFVGDTCNVIPESRGIAKGYLSDALLALKKEENTWVVTDLGTSKTLSCFDPDDRNIFFSSIPMESISDSSKLLFIKDNKLYFIEKFNLYYFDLNDSAKITKVSKGDKSYFSETLPNYETGYGRLVYSGGTFEIEPVVEDTELDFPNNFYFTYLAYKLAVAYKIKQNADPSLLLMQLKDAEDTYYDSLNRDTNSFVRITNAYNG